MNTCPCCSEVLLRHARHNKIYWFCTHCWQEMPDPWVERFEAHQSSTQVPNLLGLLASR